jgi:hypothetical protein
LSHFIAVQDDQGFININFTAHSNSGTVLKRNKISYSGELLYADFSRIRWLQH